MRKVPFAPMTLMARAPQGWRPAAKRTAGYGAPMRMGQNGPAVPIEGLLLSLALAGIGTYVGIRAGLKDKGVPSALGWIVGVVNGVGAVTILTGLAALALSPNGTPATPSTGITAG